MKSDVRMIELCVHNLPYEGERLNGNTHRPDSFNCLPISVFWNKVLFLVALHILNNKIKCLKLEFKTG
jgi:hypothetical protein